MAYAKLVTRKRSKLALTQHMTERVELKISSVLHYVEESQLVWDDACSDRSKHEKMLVKTTLSNMRHDMGIYDSHTTSFNGYMHRRRETLFWTR